MLSERVLYERIQIFARCFFHKGESFQGYFSKASDSTVSVMVPPRLIPLHCLSTLISTCDVRLMAVSRKRRWFLLSTMFRDEQIRVHERVIMRIQWTRCSFLNRHCCHWRSFPVAVHFGEDRRVHRRFLIRCFRHYDSDGYILGSLTCSLH